MKINEVEVETTFLSQSNIFSVAIDIAAAAATSSLAFSFGIWQTAEQCMISL